MENQSIKKGTVITVIFVLVLLVVGTWAYVKYVKKGTPLPTPTGQVQGESTMTITAKHQFKNGTHIVAGDVNLPTPCYILDTSAGPENLGVVTIAFTSKTSGEICAEVVTTERFKVDFRAGENVVIKATWNGQPAILNLIPARANEDLNNFELFIKG